MGTFLVYILKSALCLAAFYLFYRLLLSRDTFHRFNRVALLCVLVLSAVVPLIEVSTTETSGVGQTMLTLEEWLALAEAMTEAVPAEPVEPSRAVWPLVLLAVYGAGVLFFLVRNVCSLFRLGQLLRGTSREDISRYVKDAPQVLLLVHERDIAPFSWMRCIVIARRDLEEDGRPILLHELAHIRLGHSWDILLADLCCFVQWFNPAAWLLKQELQAVHEYEADEAVLCAGVNAREYQLLLIKKAVGTRLYSMANSLNHSKLKKRITMMQRRKSNPWARAKLLYVLPLAAVAVAAFARPEVSGVSNELSAAKVTDLAEIMKAESVKSALVPQDTARKQKYAVVDGTELPESRVGLQDLISYLGNNIRLSEETEEKGVQGKLLMKLIFNEKGELKESQVLEGVDPAIDAEALRVVKSIPRSIAEKLRGDTVAICFPISFKFAIAPKKEGMKLSDPVVSIGEKEAGNVYDMVKQAPQFPGGSKAMMEYLNTNMRYPQIAKENGIEGRVILQFVVDETGKVRDPRILRSVDPALDAEAIRLVEAMPLWTPGKQDGKAVAVRFTVPVSFKLEPEGEAASKDGVISIKAGDMPEVSNELYKHTGILGIGNRKTGTSVNPDSVLILIDGVPATEETVRTLSPQKIASVSVMKDDVVKSWAGKYGKKALNGVIVIATKDAAAHLFSQKDNVMIAVSPADKNAGQIAVEGIVTDEKGKPILGAIVRQVDAPEKGVVTDGQGCFTITVPEGSLLQFLFVDHAVTIVKAQPKMNVTLKAE